MSLRDRVLEDFEIITKLGGGGMADVFLARTRSEAGFEKLVAIKQVQPDKARSESFVKMLLDEARVAASLNHSNIAQVFDLRRAGDTYFMLMEYVHGVTLHQIRRHFESRGAPPPAPMTAFILAHLCAALEYAHTRTDAQGRSLGIIHRDVSPDNLMVSFEGEVKLIDLGIVKANQRLHETLGIQIKGKPSYMSPEQALGATVDHRTDIYAAGVVLYEMLTLRNPRMAISLPQSGPNLPSGDFSLPSEVRPDVDPTLERICLKALAIDPDNRYQHAGAMEQALQDWLKQQPYSRTDLAAWLRHEMQSERARREAMIRGAAGEEGQEVKGAKGSTRVVSQPQGYAQVIKVGAARSPLFPEPTLRESKSMFFGLATAADEGPTNELELPPPEAPRTWGDESEIATRIVRTADPQEPNRLHDAETRVRLETGMRARQSRIWLAIGAAATLAVAVVLFVAIQDPGTPESRQKSPVANDVTERVPPAVGAKAELPARLVDSGRAADMRVSAADERAHAPRKRPTQRVALKRPTAAPTPAKAQKVPAPPRKPRKAIKPAATKPRKATRNPKPLSKRPAATKPPLKRPAVSKPAVKHPVVSKPPAKRKGDKLPFEDL